MTARPRTRFTCTSCGASAPRWAGRCADCGEWNTLVEEKVEPGAARRAADGAPVHRLTDVDAAELERIGSGVPELDRLLGGGIVPGGL